MRENAVLWVLEFVSRLLLDLLRYYPAGSDERLALDDAAAAALAALDHFAVTVREG
jgi:hypothetical protein